MVFGIFIAEGILAADIIFLTLRTIILELLVKDGPLFAIIFVPGVKLGIALQRKGSPAPRC
jgi:hypothetical protein